MRAVIYTEDFEPITVIELSPMMYSFLRECGRANFAVQRPIGVTPWTTDEAPTRILRWMVRIESVIFRRGEQEAMMLFAQDEETALLLKSAFLPGQTGAVREARESAFAKGFMTAMLGARP